MLPVWCATDDEKLEWSFERMSCEITEKNYEERFRKSQILKVPSSAPDASKCV